MSYLSFEPFNIDAIRTKLAVDVAIKKSQFQYEANKLSSKLNRVKEEDYITAAVAKDLDAQREVHTPCGYIDIVSETWNVIAEVKSVAGWKHALGQVLVYAHYYPEKEPMLILFGEASDKRQALIRSHAERLNVEVIFTRGMSAINKNRIKLNYEFSNEYVHVASLLTQVIDASIRRSKKRSNFFFSDNDATA